MASSAPAPSTAQSAASKPPMTASKAPTTAFAVCKIPKYSAESTHDADPSSFFWVFEAEAPHGEGSVFRRRLANDTRALLGEEVPIEYISEEQAEGAHLPRLPNPPVKRPLDQATRLAATKALRLSAKYILECVVEHVLALEGLKAPETPPKAPPVTRPASSGAQPSSQPSIMDAYEMIFARKAPEETTAADTTDEKATNSDGLVIKRIGDKDESGGAVEGGGGSNKRAQPPCYMLEGDTSDRRVRQKVKLAQDAFIEALHLLPPRTFLPPPSLTQPNPLPFPIHPPNPSAVPTSSPYVLLEPVSLIPGATSHQPLPVSSPPRSSILTPMQANRPAAPPPPRPPAAPQQQQPRASMAAGVAGPYMQSAASVSKEVSSLYASLTGQSSS
ncbi:unnamed protein product [Vitrella brassicaformis CCMP3155]|uniref:Uncharacterized protein n=1 Tax=Vitrella brassicaformis (strain CCMP3155) TaxID=1169540 RepID=A0A0G4ECT6_VITBC|nr:unnamed protein product [Vitrella brassicaformis CCMP3155]|eukprot:CEL93360.1 unnamed protein product [Vitrella brassicaformis CCMP3155]